jgi:hypothetical protein
VADRERQWLIKSIRTLLLPAFEKFGFVVNPLGEDELQSELRKLMPLGRLRRVESHSIDLIEVQINRYSSSFRLNLGSIPPEGAVSAGRHIAQESIKTVSDLDIHFFVHPLFLNNGLFSVWHWPWRKVVASDYDDLVSKVIKLIPEIELALSEGKCSSHIRLVDLRGRQYYGDTQQKEQSKTNHAN